MTDEERRLYAGEHYQHWARHESQAQQQANAWPLNSPQPSLDDQRIVALEARVARLIEQVERLLLEAIKQLEAHVVEFPRNALRHSR